MNHGYGRRTFLGRAIAGASLVPVVARGEEGRVVPDLVRFTPDIEPLVRKLEDTERDRCLDLIAAELKGGLPYRRLLAALFLAGIRNVNPRPPGFKFHCVFVIHSAHQLSLEADERDRLLPLAFALDSFKSSQAQDVAQGDFVLRSVSGELPRSDHAWDEFRAAMGSWDAERADRAVVALVRGRGALEVIGGLWQYGARDYRNIGHKAIYVANAWRTLQTIGWQHAEPTLRSLVLGLLDFGPDKKVNGFQFEDQAFTSNQRRVTQVGDKLPGDWTRTGDDPALTRATLEILRAGAMDDVCEQAIGLLGSGKGGAGPLWDAVHLCAGELMMRQPGIFGVHTVTSANALHYAYREAGDDSTRLLMLLQGLGWMAQFRRFMGSPEARLRAGPLRELDITALGPESLETTEAAAAEQILESVGKDRDKAARQAVAYAAAFPDVTGFFDRARRLVIAKATEEHDYKYPAAIMEDYSLVSPAARGQVLATAVQYLQGSSKRDSAHMLRAREVLSGIKV